MSCKIHNNSEYDITEMKPLVRNLYGFAKDKLGFKKPPSINFVSDEANHPMLGKTAHYDPSSMEVTVYVDGRHPKDMMRSIAHELVHHMQNENGMFDDEHIAGEGYAQKDPHLRKMEEQAYLEGNMCFRDWEDQYKSKNKDIFYERRIRKMSTKKWKNKELNGLLNERWGFSMDLGKLNENSKPDYIDIDGDGDKEESMKDAAKDKKEGSDESDENVEEIRMRAGGLGKTPKKETDAAKKVSPFTKKSDKPSKPELKKEEVEITEAEEASIGQRLENIVAIRDAIRKALMADAKLNIPADKIDSIVDIAIDAASKNPTTASMARKKFAGIPPKGDSGGNQGGGTPAQLEEDED